MKHFQRYLILGYAAIVVVSGCSKNNVNPNGITTNSNYTAMLVTATGTIMYIGNVLPTLSVGAVGDYYLDVANGFIYGPKTNTSWGRGYTLQGPTGAKGATGAAGTPGTQIYSGSGTPAAGLGVVGDYYFDTTNSLLYGPKTASGWASPVSFTGPAGPTGPHGPQGPQGGAANVSTDVFTIHGSDWLWNSQYMYETSANSYTEYFTRYYVRQNNSITAGVLDTGLVIAYFQPSPVNNPSQWAPLPYQFDSSFGFTDNYVYVTALGQVTFHYFFIQTDPNATLPTLSTYHDEDRQFKLITITGKGGKFMTAHHVDLNNYDAVMRVTGLWQQEAKGVK